VKWVTKSLSVSLTLVTLNYRFVKEVKVRWMRGIEETDESEDFVSRGLAHTRFFE
jgi:hypothetical protein